jgi:hypothetical protein
MKVTNRDLLSLAKRLEAGEDPKRIAAELRGMARGPGRPKEPLKRGLRKLKSRGVADAIYNGTLPERSYPPEFALAVEQAKGKRTEADALAAEILGRGHSVRSIQKARERRPMDQTAWEEFKALAILSGRKARK